MLLFFFILHLLTPGPQRAKALQQAIPKISPKVLTQTLRGMERDGLISRKPYASVPLESNTSSPIWAPA
jgi:DNA-binding HxlR family transcriptional regulator